MTYEIEKKFTVHPSVSAHLQGGVRIVQAYLSTEVKAVVRARIKGDKAFLTIKGKNTGAIRREFEYEIPLADATIMIDEMCGDEVIDKTRYCIEFKEHTWEVDVFAGNNTGLVIAEIELAREDDVFSLPEWIDKEVTGDARYYNSNLITHPFTRW